MIEIIPFNDMQKGILETVCEEVENVFGSCIISTTKLNIPEKAYHETRGQYLSEFFLEEIFDYSKRARATKILGITMVDLYTGNLNFIFGHAYMNGRIALISLHRLNPEFYGEKKNPRLYRERVIKEALHELGHCFGLKHCSNERCVMVFSNSIFHVDNKTKEFCEQCRGVLNDIGEKVFTN